MKCVSAASGTWCGFCYAGRKAKRFYKGHYGYRAPRPVHTEYNAMLFKRPAKVDAAALKGLPAAMDPEWSGWYPTLIEWLTATQWDDGAKRETGTVMLFAEEGVFKACLRDRDGSRVAFISGGTIGDLLSTIEEGLKDDSVSWRVDRPWKKK